MFQPHTYGWCLCHATLLPATFSMAWSDLAFLSQKSLQEKAYHILLVGLGDLMLTLK